MSAEDWSKDHPRGSAPQRLLNELVSTGTGPLINPEIAMAISQPNNFTTALGQIVQWHQSDLSGYTLAQQPKFTVVTTTATCTEAGTYRIHAEVSLEIVAGVGPYYATIGINKNGASVTKPCAIHWPAGNAGGNASCTVTLAVGDTITVSLDQNGATIDTNDVWMFAIKISN